ncbi:MAG: glycosyltransferase family 2 protein [Burkholderiales bacterium]|nr:glycosyltransferase family 2 protein [Burkholderiales bacterium]
MIGVVVPAHNEEELLGPCLRALRRAAHHPSLAGERVRVLVVLDDCSDRSAAVVRRHRACALQLSERNVGAARAAGAARMLSAGARWLAFTDADSEVAPDWLAAQLALGADAVCGTVQVDDWGKHELAQAVRARFERDYRDADQHRHIHGANLGVSAQAYRRAGGFAPLACHEDVALVRALQDCGAHVAWSARPRVRTSARLAARAPEGFGDTLARLAGQVREAMHVAPLHELPATP